MDEAGEEARRKMEEGGFRNIRSKHGGRTTADWR